ncbi:MAG TPA: carboxypeptidase regulatory-like domain-containing protein [Luteitalea sp.]|nr:carboxypeptidase regulatory-like domain-containing protein [Luteitalea sp.]
MVLGGRLAAAAALAGSICAGTAAILGAQPSTGTIRGRFVVPAGEQSDRRPALIDPRAPRERVRRPGIVYLEVAPSAAFEDAPRTRERLDQRNETFVPHVLAIRTGTVVDFPNNDRIYHNVFSLSPTRRFDLGRYAVGKSKAVRFDRPGVVRVFCDIHSHMNAFIVVFAHRYFALTRPDGEFELPAVPPGTYTVAGWYEGDVRTSKSVTVRAGEASTLDLQVP